MPTPDYATRAVKVKRDILTVRGPTSQEVSGQPDGRTLETPGGKAQSRLSTEVLVSSVRWGALRFLGGGAGDPSPTLNQSSPHPHPHPTQWLKIKATIISLNETST